MQACRKLTQNLTFELGKDGQQTRRTRGGSCEIQRLGQRDETDTEMLQFLKCREQVGQRPTPAIQASDQLCGHFYVSALEFMVRRGGLEPPRDYSR